MKALQTTTIALLSGFAMSSCSTLTQNQSQDQIKGTTRNDNPIVEAAGQTTTPAGQPSSNVKPPVRTTPATTPATSSTAAGTVPTPVVPPINPIDPTAQPSAEQIPTPPVKVVAKAPGRKVHRVSINAPYVALTFDDGPHPTHTPRIINILNKYGAKGTFYVLGTRVKSHPSILAKAVASGHEIGVHTWDHPSLTRISREAVTSQMDRSVSAIRSAIGRSVNTMRPPYGAVNTDLVNFFSQKYGMSTIMWSVDTNDWRRPGVSVVTSRAVNQAKNGSIILLHDIHAPSAAAVEGIVKGLQARGFKLVTVSELLRRARSESGTAKRAAKPAAPAAPTHTPTTLPETNSKPVAAIAA